MYFCDLVDDYEKFYHFIKFNRKKCPNSLFKTNKKKMMPIIWPVTKGQ